MSIPHSRRLLFFLSLVLACGATPLVAVAGGIEYPALGHFDVEEGTLEIWFTPMAADLYPTIEPKEYRNHFTLFQMQVPDCFSMGCSWISKGKQHGFHISLDAAGRQRALLPVGGQAANRWRPGERHHLAFTWKDRDMVLWLDGRPAGSRKQSEPFSGKMAGQRLIVGEGKFRDSRVTIHAVRLSSVARNATLLDNAPPKPDLFTTLLDCFDDPATIDAGGRTTARQFSGLTDDRGGCLRGAWRLVREPSPGVALYRTR